MLISWQLERALCSKHWQRLSQFSPASLDYHRAVPVFTRISKSNPTRERNARGFTLHATTSSSHTNLKNKFKLRRQPGMCLLPSYACPPGIGTRHGFAVISRGKWTTSLHPQCARYSRAYCITTRPGLGGITRREAGPEPRVYSIDCTMLILLKTILTTSAQQSHLYVVMDQKSCGFVQYQCLGFMELRASIPIGLAIDTYTPPTKLL